MFSNLAAWRGITRPGRSELCDTRAVGGLDRARLDRAFDARTVAALDAADWFEYLGLDRRVGVLASYLEGVGDSARFVAAARAVTADKPVVIWKGGATADGARAAANHTGAVLTFSSAERAATAYANVLRWHARSDR
jgi:hypothetical protein